MFDDKLFEYLVATDQLDDVLETKNEKDDNAFKNSEKEVNQKKSNLIKERKDLNSSQMTKFIGFNICYILL